MATRTKRKGDGPDDPCTVCKLIRSAHRTPWCELCGRPHEHHEPGDYELEADAAARFAQCKADNDLPLTGRDITALRKVPNPTFLTAHDGYQPRSTP